MAAGPYQFNSLNLPSNSYWELLVPNLLVFFLYCTSQTNTDYSKSVEKIGVFGK